MRRFNLSFISAAVSMMAVMTAMPSMSIRNVAVEPGFVRAAPARKKFRRGLASTSAEVEAQPWCPGEAEAEIQSADRLEAGSAQAPPRQARRVSRFRKLPVEIEAWQVGSRVAAPDWLSEAMMKGTVRAAAHQVDTLNIDTLEGTMRASPGDWIIRGVAGELYPCKPDIFAQTYEAVDG